MSTTFQASSLHNAIGTLAAEPFVRAEGLE